jgi:hypothetical protein
MIRVQSEFESHWDQPMSVCSNCQNKANNNCPVCRSEESLLDSFISCNCFRLKTQLTQINNGRKNTGNSF